MCFKFAAHGVWQPLKLYWYDGGMRPFTPDELSEEGKSLPAAGTLFVGDAGVILNNELIPAKKMQEYRAAKGLPEPQPRPRERSASDSARTGSRRSRAVRLPAGNFVNAANCAEAIALARAAIRYSRKIFSAEPLRTGIALEPQAMKFTNASDAESVSPNREYRDGWKLTSA